MSPQECYEMRVKRKCLVKEVSLKKMGKGVCKIEQDHEDPNKMKMFWFHRRNAECPT